MSGYWLDLPRRGVLFDVEHNGFWLDEWGPRPGSLEEALGVAHELVAAARRRQEGDKGRERAVVIAGYRACPIHLPLVPQLPTRSRL